MTNQELKKLSRRDLLELLLAQSKEVERLKGELSQAQEALNKRKLDLTQAGSIAQAALQINGVFSAAEAAAAQWLENVQYLSAHQEELQTRIETQCRQTAAERMAQTERRCQAMEEEAKKKCEEMLAKAQQEVHDQLAELGDWSLPLDSSYPPPREYRPASKRTEGRWRK